MDFCQYAIKVINLNIICNYLGLNCFSSMFSLNIDPYFFDDWIFNTVIYEKIMPPFSSKGYFICTIPQKG